jgi:hypothetical protein
LVYVSFWSVWHAVAFIASAIVQISVNKAVELSIPMAGLDLNTIMTSARVYIATERNSERKNPELVGTYYPDSDEICCDRPSKASCSPPS